MNEIEINAHGVEAVLTFNEAPGYDAVYSVEVDILSHGYGVCCSTYEDKIDTDESHDDCERSLRFYVLGVGLTLQQADDFVRSVMNAVNTLELQACGIAEVSPENQLLLAI